MGFGLLNKARESDAIDQTYPQTGTELSGWAPSSVPVAITPLEFDIQAASFADGFGHALSTLIGHSVHVAVQARGGALFSTMSTGRDELRRLVPRGIADLRLAWRRSVRPAVIRHERFFATVDAAQPAEVARVLRQVAERMTSVTYQHHTLILPVRLAIAEFCDVALSQGVVSTELDALALLAGRVNATTRLASLVWDHRAHPVEMPPLAQEGDGYGMAHAGWLESPRAPAHLADLYRHCDNDRSPQALLARTSRRRRQRWRAVESILAAWPVAVRERFADVHQRAQHAAWLTEGHAPLMHARLTHAMRQLVHRLGRRLVELDLIDQPGDLLFLRIHELEHIDPNLARSLVAQRRADFAQFQPPPIDSRPIADGQDPLGNGPVARRIRQVLRSAPVGGGCEGGIAGYPAAPGRARGRLRRVVRQADLAKIERGDVILAGDCGAVWSYAAPVACAFVAATGSVFSHLASLARDYGLPCVVGVGQLHDVSDGERLDVDGDTGIITRESEQS